MGKKPAIIDLRKVYLQLKTEESLWPFQTVVFQNKRYCLTRLGFGLNVAPIIMKSVVSTIIDQDELVKRGASAYVDDVFVNEEVVSLDYVKRHFEKYCLERKESEQIGCNGVHILGLRVYKLVGHLPVSGWLRAVCSLLKRRVVSLTKDWDNEVCDENLKGALQEVYDEVAKCDPAYSDWAVHSDEGNVWVDASSLASGAVIQVGKTTLEDTTWLRKEMSEDHINMAELDAVMRGMSMALTWKLKKVTIFTDSVTVFQRVSDALTGKSRLKSKAMGKMLIRKRLSVLQKRFKEYGINVNVKLVPSKDNLANALTRVQSRCIHKRTGHFGVKHTLNFVRQVIPTATKNDVRKVTKNCEPCQSIDPAPVQWEKEKLSVKENWERVAMDIMNFCAEKFLTLVYCGPSRYALWRQLSSSYGSIAITRILRLIFCKRGAPSEILTDNEATFKTEELRSFLDGWGVRIRFRAVYYPDRNEIVERNRRTIKRIA
ncbi:uncharacterized protein LOC124818174 [Hydra vulgaris]|uniref:uncharacterized protein LOC124818174 n=1 Tax=Hydra vulgaris TaxID=6087 RepID=UPI001F5F80CD|nr:uncharacterized protein LOC124818174 [Hydra vulgaris]